MRPKEVVVVVEEKEETQVDNTLDMERIMAEKDREELETGRGKE